MFSPARRQRARGAGGVVVPHQGLASLAETQVELFRLAADARVLQFASISTRSW
ncbi:MAG: hypothetical protein JF625_19555 [Inquilinus limosus]|uniref:Uncharacterized protein n=1 Tax=Inquilinus limosus TaxID=171674 RepID=A0A952FQ92_9PROT|nr:hypothetical protein [Inquilinus limosus]